MRVSDWTCSVGRKTNLNPVVGGWKKAGSSRRRSRIAKDHVSQRVTDHWPVVTVITILDVKEKWYVQVN